MSLESYLYLRNFYKYFYKFYEKIFGKKKHKKRSKIFKKDRSPIITNIRYFHLALGANKLILFFEEIKQKICDNFLSNTKF